MEDAYLHRVLRRYSAKLAGEDGLVLADAERVRVRDVPPEELALRNEQVVQASQLTRLGRGADGHGRRDEREEGLHDIQVIPEGFGEWEDDQEIEMLKGWMQRDRLYTMSRVLQRLSHEMPRKLRWSSRHMLLERAGKPLG